jgi:hypothetical protein
VKLLEINSLLSSFCPKDYLEDSAICILEIDLICFILDFLKERLQSKLHQFFWFTILCWLGR